MHAFVMFAQPFRMPDFFLISGLFLAVVIDRDWRTYLDRKVVHFAYFLRSVDDDPVRLQGAWLRRRGGWRHVGLLYLESFIEPFGTLWFIILLPVFFVVTKLYDRLRHWRSGSSPPRWRWRMSMTGWTVIDEFCARFVYFYSGYLLASYVFALSDRSRERPALALAGLALWALVNGGLVIANVQPHGRSFRWRSASPGPAPSS
jgi:uncharacterized membrane protein YcfT